MTVEETKAILEANQKRYFRNNGKYYTLASPKPLVATTTILKQLFPFDEVAAAEKVANKMGITVEEVIAMWAAGAHRGNTIHNIIQSAIVTKTKPNLTNPLLDDWDKFNITQVIQFLSSRFQFIANEHIAVTDEYLAKMDTLMISNKTLEVIIIEIKTRGEYKLTSNYFSEILPDYDTSNYTKDSLQCGIYQHILRDCGIEAKTLIINLPKDKSWDVYQPRVISPSELENIFSTYSKITK